MVLFLKNLLFTLIVPGTVAVYVPFLISSGEIQFSGVLGGIGIVFWATGVSIYSWCVWDFATHGSGTPAPIDAPKLLVSRGLYSLSRNPMYVAVVSMILGWGAAFASVNLLVYATVVAFAFHLRVVFHEEPHLRNVFGKDYDVYCARTNRWLPRFHKPAA